MPRSQSDAVTTVMDAASRIGFEPVLRYTRGRGAATGEVEVVLQHCPFEELARTDPDTVCALHLGLVEGLVEAAGGASVVGLQVADPRRGNCRITLRPAQ